MTFFPLSFFFVQSARTPKRVCQHEFDRQRCAKHALQRSLRNEPNDCLWKAEIDRAPNFRVLHRGFIDRFYSSRIFLRAATAWGHKSSKSADFFVGWIGRIRIFVIYFRRHIFFSEFREIIPARSWLNYFVLLIHVRLESLSFVENKSLHFLSFKFNRILVSTINWIYYLKPLIVDRLDRALLLLSHIIALLYFIERTRLETFLSFLARP